MTKLIWNIFYCFSFLILFNFISAVNAQNSIDVIRNGELDNGLYSWQLKLSGTASATISICDDSLLSGSNSLQINITNGGENLGNVRVSQSKTLMKGRYYTLYLLAKSNTPCDIQPVFTLSNSYQTELWSGEILHLTNTPQRFGPLIFRNESEDAQRAYAFKLGGINNATIWLDSIVMNMTDDPENFREEELLQAALRDTLNNIISQTENDFFKLSCQSIINVTGSTYNLLFYDYSNLINLYNTFADTAREWSPRKLETYFNRKYPFLLSWISPTDGKVSFAYLLPPENFNPETIYPLYVSLHGYMPVTDNPISYLDYRYSQVKIMHEPYEDGYLLFPWGRGNLYYEGIGESDVWEAISYMESILKIDSTRMYLTGHSMGGFGAFNLGQKSAGVWAALGIHAAVYQHGTTDLLISEVAENLKTTPTYFVCGDTDDLYSSNQQAFSLVQNTGNTDIMFVTFHGGHEYLYENLDNMHHWLMNWVNNNPINSEEIIFSVPFRFELNNCFPNPFNSSTTIIYSLPEEAKVKIKIFNTLGQKVNVLVDDFIPAGEYRVSWNAHDVSSGIYLCRMTVEGKQSFQKTIKLILLK